MLSLRIVGQNSRYRRPEPRRMIVMQNMCQLMDDNIVDCLGRRHHKHPGETQSIVTRTRSPSGDGAGNLYAGGAHPHNRGKEFHPVGNYRGCQLAVKGDDRGSNRLKIPYRDDKTRAVKIRLIHWLADNGIRLSQIQKGAALADRESLLGGLVGMSGCRMLYNPV